VRGGTFTLGKAVSDPTDMNRGPQSASSASSASSTNLAERSTSAPGHRAQLLLPHPLSSKLEGLRRELIACGQRLQATAPFQGRSFFSETLTGLVQLTCRIAVIGQVKAGKSSFINAFIGIPGLLPTDINPWTTAVTHLHFGCQNTPPDVAAQFTFFAANEWEQLTHGGGRIRELTQRLVPGFEVELLQERVAALRRRSEERLGPALAELLGRRHLFSALSREILARYVCSGAPGQAGEHSGIYSDIVKSADLYFANNDFGLPTTVIDTPGTNDPFLVRDEITRRALEEADIYVVMLTARQALSSADVALLRILRGLQKDRIAVFINRIDELGDVLGDTPIVVQHVRTGLRREFPASEFPVIAGSAFWANLAITGSDGDIARVLSTKVKTYAERLEQQVRINAAEELPRETLLRCSGVPALSHGMASLTLNSHASHVLREARSLFTELAQVGRNATLQAITIVEAEERAAVSGQQQGEDELRIIDAEVVRSEHLIIALQGLLVDLRASLDRVIEERCAKIGDLLRDAVVKFSLVECASLEKAIVEGRRGRIWQCETSRLRRSLEECFVATYRATAEEISGLQAQVFPQLQQLLSKHDPRWRGSEDTGAGSLAAELPSLGALSQIVALDLEEPWLRRWWASDSGRQGQIAKLDKLIKQEFQPIVDALVKAAHVSLKSWQASALQKSTQIYVGLVEFLQEQNSARRARTRALISPGNRVRSGELPNKLAERIAELRREIPIVEALLMKLEAIDQAWSDVDRG
jgi:Dynamin family